MFFCVCQASAIVEKPAAQVRPHLTNSQQPKHSDALLEVDLKLFCSLVTLQVKKKNISVHYSIKVHVSDAHYRLNGYKYHNPSKIELILMEDNITTENINKKI